MRMWMVEPKMMCRQHLLGEHNELHMIRGTIIAKKKIDGYIENGLLEPLRIKDRHDALAAEMTRRGYKHKSPLEQPALSMYAQEIREATVNKEVSAVELLRRCKNCQSILKGNENEKVL